ncbi:MAG TPA: 50S ribosomal protein L15 [Armatimonadota bacterium]|nr:50S ribosomal protein L15 [Armatimonadota bacterium]
MQLHDLGPNPGARHTRKRIGRGRGSGHGKTSTRGQKGRKSRGQVPLGFEGGQTPLHRRLPLRRGFRNPYGVVYSIVNLEQLAAIESGVVITPELLVEQRIIRKMLDGVKILGNGELSGPMTIRAHRFSESALQKIESAGGKAEVI